MSIVCGTDFSEPSLRAAHVAALLAARANVRLHLVHTIELSFAEIFAEPRGTLFNWAERQLRSTAEGLRALGADVQVHLEFGAPDERLEEVAALVAAKLIIVAALGNRRPNKWQLGSNAYRLAHDAHVPVLLVRALEPFEAWVNHARPLRILLGVDLSLSSEAAMRWVHDLRVFGPCEVIAVHLYWPPEQFHRFGLAGVRSYVEPDPEVTKTLQRDFSTRLSAALGATPIKTRLEPHLGRIGDRLATLATEEHVDLVVVGSHGRNAAGRLLHGMTSHDVIHWAGMSVACVPAPGLTDAASAPRFANVLVATDFSPTGDSAVPLAYSIVADGGTVHMVHVVKEGSRRTTDPRDIFPAASTETEVQAAARQQLLELIPGKTLGTNKVTQLHVLESNDAAQAICQAAERLDAGVLCIGTHGRTGVSKAVLGSVAQSVLSGTRRPVLLARKPVE